MKRSSGILYAVIFMFSVFLFLPFAPINAQTNFVKYVDNPILPLGNPGEWDDVEAAYADVLFDGSIYQMWYSGVHQLNYYRIGYATSSDGINWNKHANNPVLNVGASGEFDAVSSLAPMVLFDGSLYEMWYSGGLLDEFSIGYATAADPASWTKHPGNPVLTKGSLGQWDQINVFVSAVMRSDTVYQMWFSGQSTSGIWQTGYATSNDGINWNKHPNNPVLPAGASGEWDSKAAFASTVLFEDGQYQMWYHGGREIGSPTEIKIGYATSPDGINWTKHPGNPILKPEPDSWDSDNTMFPRVIKNGYRYRMWYTGRKTSSIDRLGYTEDFSNAAHVDSIKVSPARVPAGYESVRIGAYIANPHDENLTAQALIKDQNGNVIDSVQLDYDADSDIWWGSLPAPTETHDYSVGIELTNHSAGYVHNSFDWGITKEFYSYELTHTFTQTAHTNFDQRYSSILDMVVTPDSNIFLAHWSDGLRAYSYDGTSFTSAGHINDCGEDSRGNGLAVKADGTVFLANWCDGLRAYTYDGSSFTNTAHINEGGNAVAIGSDGTVFLAGDGLRAYLYDGASFINTAHIDDGGAANDVEVGSDGTIFLANGNDGLRAYSYDGSSFTNTAHIHDSGEEGDAMNVAIASDGTVFLANGTYDDGERDDGLRAYTYDGSSFTNTAHIDDFGSAWDVEVSSDSLVFLANTGFWGVGSGLWAYHYDGNSFRNTAFLDISGDIAVAPDGTLFLSSGEGLVAYTYNLKTATSVNAVETELPAQFQLSQNYPNPFNPSTTITYDLPSSGHVALKIYNTLGQEIRTLVHAAQPVGSHQVVWDGRDNNGNIVPSGVYFYQLRTGTVMGTRKMVLMK